MKLSKAYEPSAFESDIYALWEKSGCFVADPTSNKEHFSIAMPPPNETGTLSVGHALFLTLQDIMIRRARQEGKDALWLPGTDHAALAVNAIIEKQLADEGKTKHDIGREEFLKRTREFVAGSRDKMIDQMRAMGASADWTRLRYTLDDSLSRAVNETFIKMYEAGLIYRGNRIVNWDPNLETNVSDVEVIHEEETTTFYIFQYGPFQIGTARPETKFGDKYVVVHPDDERYKHFKHGDTFEAEWINGKVTATVIKDEAIDMEFGTGAMTITPWHDQTDFEIAERHNLDKEQIIDFHGKLLPIAQEFAGMTIEEARPKIVEKLRQKGLVVAEDNNYVHTVAVNERGKGIIEPQIREQWFVDVNKKAVPWKGKTKSLKEVMREVVENGETTIIPKRFEKIYFNWVDNLHDWCISRQIWWGHRIPAWYRFTEDKTDIHVGTEPSKDDSEGWHDWEQDPDTLDTWFSSALWTWSTLLDPELATDDSIPFEEVLKNSPDFQAYHPTSVLETGWDILPFWVMRMILATTFMTGQIPFKQVYLHGMVRAEDGKKMSKSRPESIVDPLEVIEKYGTDALRIALIWGISPGNDQNWSYGKLQATRNFCNKLWNIARYIEGLSGEEIASKNTHTKHPKPQTIADHWMLHNLQHTAGQVNRHLDNRAFSEAFDCLYHFVWDDFADWYIEASKVEQNIPLLQGALRTILVLLHPFMPFVTETIWQTLNPNSDELLANEKLSAIEKSSAKQAKEFELLKAMIIEVRAITSVLELKKVNLYHRGTSDFFDKNKLLITRLSAVNEIREVEDGNGMRLTESPEECWLDIDHDSARRYSDKLAKKLAEQQKLVVSLESRLSSDGYVKNAPRNIVSQTREQLKTAQERIDDIKVELKRFKNV